MSRAWVLVYWLEGHNMIGWCMYIWLWNCIQLYDKSFFALAYPFVWCVFYGVVFLSLRWSSIYWCEQMREILVVNREMVVPLLSLWNGFRFWALLLGLWPHVLPGLWALFLEYCRYVFIFCFWHRGVPSFSSVFFWTTMWSEVYTPGPCYYIILCDASFN